VTRRLLLGVGAALAAHVAIRLVVPDSVQHDEAEQLVLAQAPALGYWVNPPLYTWLQYLVFRGLGAGVLGLTLLKHGILFAGYLLLYLAARRALRDAGLAALAALALWLLPPVAIEAHRDLTHSVLAMVLGAALALALVGLADRRTTGGYALLGALVGLAALAKYNALLLVAALLLSAASLPALRPVATDPRLLLSALTALAVAGPHLGWLVANWTAAWEDAAAKLGLGAAGGLAPVVASAADLVLATLVAIAPLGAALVLVFPAAWRGAGRDGGPRSPLVPLFTRAIVGAVVALAVVVVLFGARFKWRWLDPLVYLAPLPLFLRVQASAPDARRRRRFAVLAGAAAVLSLLLRAGEIGVGPRLGLSSRLDVPTRALAAGIRDAGFRGGTIVTDNLVLAGNLRLAFPDAPVLTAELPRLTPPPGAGGAPCLLVWRVRGEVGPPRRFAEFVRARLGVDVPDGPGAVRVLRPPGTLSGRPYAVAFVRVSGAGTGAGCG